MRRLRNRQGATLVIVAILLTLLVGMAGVAVDISRLYVFKAQLQTTVDASALAAIIEVERGRATNAAAVALQYVPFNQVERQTATVDAGNVEPGTWDFTTRSFAPLGSWTDPGLNAVRVTATYPAAFTLATVFGVQGHTVQAVSVAALGSVGPADCLQPFGIPYSNLLYALGHDPADVGYNLTDDDIATLRTLTATSNINFKIGAQGTSYGTPLPGNYYPVDYEPIMYATGKAGSPTKGGDAYRSNINGCTGSNQATISPGDYLLTENGNMVGPTGQGILALCGGVLGSNGECNPPAGVAVRAPIWDYTTTQFTGTTAVHVKYIGAFVITRYSASTGVYGYFSSMAASGVFSSNPGPLTKAVLVQ